MVVKKPPVIFKGSPYFTSRDGLKPEAIVVHVADGSLAGCDSWFNDNPYGVSAHFCIGRSGAIHQYVNEADAAHANGAIEQGYSATLIDENGYQNPNDWTISIEHEGWSGEIPPPVQLEASAQLSAWLFEAHLFPGGATGVAIDRKHILRHGEISPKSRPNCPGWSAAVLDAYVARVKTIIESPERKIPEVHLIRRGGEGYAIGDLQWSHATPTHDFWVREVDKGVFGKDDIVVGVPK